MRKDKKLIISILMIVLANALTSCNGCAHKHNVIEKWKYNETSHWKECKGCNEKIELGEHSFKNNGSTKKCEICEYNVEYTQKENFDEWNVGCKHALNYDGEYTTYGEETVLFDDVSEIYEHKIIESYSKDKWFSYDEETTIETDNTQKSESTLEVIKKIDNPNDDEKNYLYYREIYENNKTSKYNEYITEERLINSRYYFPMLDLGSLYITTCDSYEELKSAVIENPAKDAYGFEYGKLTKFEMEREEDGSVSLNMIYYRDYIENITDDDYKNTTREFISKIIVSDGKVQTLFGNVFINDFYNDETKNTCEKYFSQTTYKYEFDNENYESYCDRIL